MIYEYYRYSSINIAQKGRSLTSIFYDISLPREIKNIYLYNKC